jgi:catechol 2,3-dioxygenase-like lactoylglutathione lyase family enzyme
MTCTAVTRHVELALDDVPAGARFFRHVLALPVRYDDLQHAEVRLTADVTVRLAPARPYTGVVTHRTPGPMLQLEVPVVSAALVELRRRGATVLIEPVLTEWGTESAFVAGPGDLVIEVYRPHTA